MNRRTAILTLGVIGLAGVLVPVLAHEGHSHGPISAPFDLNSPRELSAETKKTIGLETREVDFGAVEEIVRLTGTARVPADRLWAVSAPTEGRVVEARALVGDRVKAGDVLAVIASPGLAQMSAEASKAEVEIERLASEIAQAGMQRSALEAQLGGAREQAEIAEQEAARLSAGGESVSTNLVSQRRATALAARAHAAQIELGVQQQDAVIVALGKVKGALERSVRATRASMEIASGGTVMSSGGEGGAGGVGTITLRAPAAGVVIRREAMVGAGVSAGAMLFAVADTSAMTIEAEVTESQIAQVAESKGKAVRVRQAGASQAAGADFGEERLIGTGVVRALSPVVDPIKRTSHLLVDVANAGGAIIDGMFVSVALVQREAKDVVVVPASAVLNDGPMHFVFIKEKDAYVKRDIVPGVRDDRVVEVVEGLAPGDEVVVIGAHALTQIRPAGAAAGHEHDHDHDH